jgi:dienelactone hydrolase
MPARCMQIGIAAALLCGLAGGAFAQNFMREEIRIPMAAAGPRGLEALVVRPDQLGRYPLALISHGSPRDAAERRKMSPFAFMPQAIEFARRGWAAVIVMRRGYGGSAGNWMESSGPCNDRDYVTSATTSAADLRAAIADLTRRDDIDATRIIGVGQSAGGFATIALTADPPANLLAGISFAGGRGSRADHDVCQEDRLVEAMRSLGRRSRLPMLWVYAENDKFFGPALARRMHNAFVSAGGTAEFVMAPPFGRDGHTLFSLAGIPDWTPIADRFLGANRLVFRESLLPPPPLPALDPPASLSPAGRKSFDSYRAAPPRKAFAVSPGGAYGWRSGRRTADDAKEGALGACREHGKDCRIFAVDDANLR